MGVGQMGQWLRAHSDLSKNSAQFLAPMVLVTLGLGNLMPLHSKDTCNYLHVDTYKHRIRNNADLT